MNKYDIIEVILYNSHRKKKKVKAKTKSYIYLRYIDGL